MIECQRLNTAEVCALARYTRSTLWARIDAGKMPKPIDRGSGGFLFDKSAVLIALGMFNHDAAPEQKSWDFDPIAYRKLRAGKVRRSKAAGGRNPPGVLPSPGAPPSLRLVGNHPPAQVGQ